ncbi:histidine kinase [Blastococcus sp. SYSU DS0617]
MPSRPPGRPLGVIRPRSADAALAAGLSAVGLVEAVLVGVGDRPGALVTPLLLPLPLLGRRSHPLAAALAVAAGFAVQLAEPVRAFDRTATCYVVLMLALYSLGRHGAPSSVRLGGAAIAATVGVVIGVADTSLLSGVLGAALVGTAVGMGHAVAGRATLRELLEEQSREIAASAAVAEEAAATAVRTQLAGDVQDVVQRHVERMLAGARAAQRRTGDPDRATTLIAGVESAGREALDELRRMLGLLRDHDRTVPLRPHADPGPTGPAPAPLPGRSGRPRTRSDWLPPAVIVLAAGEAAWSAADAGAARPAVVAACVAGAMVAAPLVAHRSAPVAASAATWALATGAVLVVPLPVLALGLTAPVLAFAAGAHAERWSWAGLAVGWAGVAGVNVAAGGAGAGDFAVPVVLVGLAWLAGRAMAEQVALGERVAGQSAELARLRDVRSATASAQERLRIARELHDVVAHTLMVMVVQAGAARRSLDVDPDRSAAALAVVVDTGNSALAELARVLSVVDAPAAPSDTGLGRLSALVGRARSTGLDVDLRTAGPLGDVPGGVDLAAYRIVQEALTNVIRHAGATRVTVHLDVVDGRLVVRVRDDGTPHPGGTPGNGLAGMRERVRLYDGEFTAGPAALGGFAVSATFPLGTARQEQHA